MTPHETKRLGAITHDAKRIRAAEKRGGPEFRALAVDVDVFRAPRVGGYYAVACVRKPPARAGVKTRNPRAVFRVRCEEGAIKRGPTAATSAALRALATKLED